MRDTLLVVNAGSSSLKFHIYDIGGGTAPVFAFGGQVSGIGAERPSIKIRDQGGQILLEREFSAGRMADLQGAQQVIAEWLTGQLKRPPVAVGHRIVHGGPDFNDSVVIDGDILHRLDALAPLAPLHQRNNLSPVHVIREHWPQMLQVACFDTAFHRGYDDVTERFALPQSYFDRGIRRYGFHGLSYEYIAQRLQQEMPAVAAGRVIVAHLGSGASACALRNGRSVENTMSFTALDGLPMSTRPGRLDAGVVLWMLEQGMTHGEIQRLLYTESGLKGLSGISGDVRDLLASSAPEASLALRYYAYRVAENIAGLCVAAGGLDTLVFTAGVGENSPPVRASICERLAWLGIELDPQRNAANAGQISSSDSRIRVYVEPTNEEWVIAGKTLQKLRLQKE